MVKYFTFEQDSSTHAWNYIHISATIWVEQTKLAHCLFIFHIYFIV